MYSNTQITYEQKYKVIIRNRDRFNNTQKKIISQLQSYLMQVDSNKSSISSWKIQIQTFYKCCIPAYQSLLWEQQINYKVPYPIACIVAFKQLQEKYAAVDVKIATWAESGGVRLIPIKFNFSKQKIKQLINNSHALIIPQFQGDIQFQFFANLCEIVKENKDYPVLALGNSALLMMSYLNDSEQLRKKIKFDLKFHNSQMTTFVSHQDPLFCDLDLKVRLQVQNRPRVTSSSIHLPLQIFKAFKNESVEIIGIGKGRAQDWVVVIAKQSLVYYCFVDPRPNGSNLEHVSFCHKLVNNFMQEIRKRQKKIIDQKLIELGQYKVVLRNESYFYNVDVKLQKI